jgi:hypothetical protein
MRAPLFIGLIAGIAIVAAASAVQGSFAVFTDQGSVDGNTLSTGAFAVTRSGSWTTGLAHTAGSGANRLLVFAVGYEHTGSDPGVSSVSYGGQSLTRIDGAVAGTTTYARVELWYLNDAGIAAASSNAFSVVWGGATPSQPMYAAATYKYVNQSSPIGGSSTNSTNSSSPNPITAGVAVADETMAVGAAISGNNGSYTWNNGWSEGSDQTSGSTVTMSTADHAETGFGTDTASATHSGPNRQAIVATVLNSVTASAPTATPTFTPTATPTPTDTPGPTDTPTPTATPASSITFRSAASAGAPSGTLTLTISKPSGTAAGDVMVAGIAVRPSTATITPPSGWTLVRRIDNSNSNSNSLAIYTKVAGGSEPASYNWTFSTSTGSVGGILTFSGVNTATPVDVENGQNTANGLSHASPDVTTTVANTMLVTFHGFSSAATWTPPTGMNEAVDVASITVPSASGISLEGNYVAQAAAGATGAKTATANNDSDVGNAAIVALQP